MKYSRELKVGILAVIAIFLLYFGFNFLKGVNIFSSTSTYYGSYSAINGLTEQSPVYVKGYKVGQVDKITYDFRRDNSFVVTFSVNKDISLPHGTELALISDGLLGGTALQLNIPLYDTDDLYHRGDTLPTTVVPGLIDNLQDGLLADLSAALQKLDTLLYTANSQLEGDHLKSALANVDRISSDLKSASADIKRVMANDVPVVVADAKSAVSDIKNVAANVRDVDIAATIDKLDAVVADLKNFTQKVNSKDGTVGMLLNDKELYSNINETIQSVDSLVVDLKANPKRYVHFSVFGNKKDK
ncbi:MAG: MCE family protein [Paludibacteraceae bacterium]|nr:MCE family protein [Paludibacteraceae bacterium]